MFKKKHFSVHNDFKTGLFYKLSLFFGIIFLIFYTFLKIISSVMDENAPSFFQMLYFLSQSNAVDSIIAFSIILLGIGIILYFFHSQFAKLSEIADEIENKGDSENLK